MTHDRWPPAAGGFIRWACALLMHTVGVVPPPLYQRRLSIRQRLDHTRQKLVVDKRNLRKNSLGCSFEPGRQVSLPQKPLGAFLPKCDFRRAFPVHAKHQPISKVGAKLTA